MTTGSAASRGLWGFRSWFRRCPECGQRWYSATKPNDTWLMFGQPSPTRCRCCGKGYGTGDPENLPALAEDDLGGAA